MAECEDQLLLQNNFISKVADPACSNKLKLNDISKITSIEHFQLYRYGIILTVNRCSISIIQILFLVFMLGGHSLIAPIMVNTCMVLMKIN